jgi:hypothetical protein
MPLSTIPDTSRMIRTANESWSGTTAIVRSMKTPTRIAFDTVPKPGRCRSGIHSRRMRNDAAIATTPTEMGMPIAPSRRAAPSWRTSHGKLPRRDSMTRPADMPKRRSPP